MMKTYQEMSDNVLSRIKEYEIKKKRRQKAAITTISVFCCLCIVTVLSIKVFNNKSEMTVKLETTEKLVDNTKNSNDQKSDEQTGKDIQQPAVSEFKEESLNTIQGIFHYSPDINTHEDIMVDYYPKEYEKYNSVICCALANIMNEETDNDRRYPVVIEIREKVGNSEHTSYLKGIDDLIESVNDNLDQKIVSEDGMKVNDEFQEKYEKEYPDKYNRYNFTKKYYFNLTKDQILGIAEVVINNKGNFRAKLCYVGSGKEVLATQIKEGKPGLIKYCEANGDHYIMKDDAIECTWPVPLIDDNGDLSFIIH